MSIDRSRLRDVRTILFIEPRGMLGADDDRLLFWDKFLELGRDYRRQHPNAVADRMASARDDDVMTLVYTSGTTGPPKGAMLTNRNCAFCVDKLVSSHDRVPGGPPTPDDQILTYLPLCHVAERIFSTWTAVSGGAVLNFAESIETVNENLREVQPTLFFAVPRIWEKLQAGIQVKMQEAARWRRALFGWALGVGRRHAEALLAGRRPPLLLRALRGLAYVLVLRALQNHVGLRRARLTFTAAAAISPEVLRFFHAIGIPVREGYGMTECTGFSFVQREGEVRLGTVGRAVPGLEHRIAADGELLKRGDAVFVGYYRDPEATAATIRDGWLHSGDVAEEDPDGQLRIVDRKKAIFVTAGGKNVSPSLVENALKVSPYVKEAVVVGDGEKYLAALVQIDFENVGQWATERRLPYTNFRSLARLREVRELVAAEIDRTNDGLAPVEQVRAFRLLDKELDHDDNEVTATMKVRRKTIYEKFAPLIAELYGEERALGRETESASR
jgi:long-chain acyl-CoA synthetase